MSLRGVIGAALCIAYLLPIAFVAEPCRGEYVLIAAGCLTTWLDAV